jgi:hypothetical protein
MAAPNPEPGDLGDRDEHEAAATPSSEPLADAVVEERWADIVGRLGDVEPRWTDDDTAVRPETRLDAPPEPLDEPSPEPSPVARFEGPRDWPVTPEVEALEEADGHFTPPEPEPVLSRDPLLTLAWTVLVGVPVLTVLGVLVRAIAPWLALPSWLGPLGGVSFALAVAVLVWRMPHRRDPDDQDPGAVV